VCLLALLHPTQIIDKLVECAVQNKGHIECVIKIFRLVPSLVCVQNPLKRLAVYNSLERRLLALSQREAQNFVNFCRLLIMVCTVHISSVVYCFYMNFYFLLFCLDYLIVFLRFDVNFGILSLRGISDLRTLTVCFDMCIVIIRTFIVCVSTCIVVLRTLTVCIDTCIYYNVHWLYLSVRVS